MLKPRTSLLQKKAFWSTFWGRRGGEYYRGFKIEKTQGKTQNLQERRFLVSTSGGEGAFSIE